MPSIKSWKDNSMGWVHNETIWKTQISRQFIKFVVTDNVTEIGQDDHEHMGIHKCRTSQSARHPEDLDCWTTSTPTSFGETNCSAPWLTKESVVGTTGTCGNMCASTCRVRPE